MSKAREPPFLKYRVMKDMQSLAAQQMIMIRTLSDIEEATLPDFGLARDLGPHIMYI